MNQLFFYFIVFLIITTGCSKKKNDWFVIEKIDNRTYIISEPNSSQGNSSYLIIGDNEAILFDSGTGENKGQSISNIVDSLTKVPITLLLSHFHFDHIGNTDEFNNIGIPEIPLLNNRLSDDGFINLSKDMVLTNDTVMLKISKQLPLGKEIDLGNRRIRILHTPGHSNESISIIDSESKYIFTGDLIYNGLLLFDDCHASLQSINHLLTNSDANYRLFGAHGKPEVSYARMPQIQKAIKRYLREDYSADSVHSIDFFGTSKKVYQIENVSFIDGYSDVFIEDIQ
jgi:glyoxylase-like metal-dependent hydrolase (beta-lactamase superfamily II)